MIGVFATGLLGTMAIVITGFVACTEFGSYAFVHPVLRRLPEKQWLQVATARIPMDLPPADWRAMRARWEAFQALRSWLMLGGFAAITVAVVSA